MTEIVAEERRKDPLLQNLDIKMGMNTGKIVGCIIGTKVARYDIFGQDVLVSRLIQIEGVPGQVRVSESFRKLISRKSFIYDTLDFQEWHEIDVPSLQFHSKTYICE